MTQKLQLLSQPTTHSNELFDIVLDRKHSDSSKWNYYDENILPMWIADMDFASPKAVVDALKARVEEAAFGYGQEPDFLRDLICARMENLYNWRISPEHIVFLPGLVCGLNLVASVSGERGSGILVNTPVYGPFLSAPTNQERELQEAPQEAADAGSWLCAPIGDGSSFGRAMRRTKDAFVRIDRQTCQNFIDDGRRRL